MDGSGTKAPWSVSRENSWSNEASAMDTSHYSDHQTVSEIVSSDVEMVKNDPYTAGVLAKPQLHGDDSGPVPATGLMEHGSSTGAAHKPVSSGTEHFGITSKSSDSTDVIERPVAVPELPRTAISANDAEPSFVSDHGTVKENRADEVCGERMNRDLVRDDSLDKRPLRDADDSKRGLEKSDSESTPKNDLSLPEEDVSVHLTEAVSENQTSSTLSSRNGVKPSPGHEKHQPLEAELYTKEIPAADADRAVCNAPPKSVDSDTGLSREDNRDLLQPERSCGEDVSRSSHATHSDRGVQSVSSTGVRHSTSSRRSASGASRAGSGSSKAAAAVDSNHSESTDDISSRNDSIRSSVSSKAHSLDGDRSSNADSISTESDIVRRGVSGCVESIESRSGNWTGSVHSSVSSKTYTISSKDSNKVRQHDADVAIPKNAVDHTGSEVQQQQQQHQGDVGADTDDDIADLEPDQSLHTKPTEMVDGIVDKMSATTKPGVSPAEAGTGPEVGLGEDVANLEDEQIPEELDSVSDIAEDGHSLIHSGRDSGNLRRRTTPEPQSDTSETKTGRNSDDLHRIIRRAAEAVESFVTEVARTSVKVGGRDEERLSDGHSEKAADDASRSLISDAIDQMLTVRKHKMAAASKSSATPTAVPLSPSALSDSAKSTTSTSSDGQVPPPFIIIHYLWRRHDVFGLSICSFVWP